LRHPLQGIEQSLATETHTRGGIIASENLLRLPMLAKYLQDGHFRGYPVHLLLPIPWFSADLSRR
jgi:hypothetical protein